MAMNQKRLDDIADPDSEAALGYEYARELLDEIDCNRRQIDQLTSYLKGISRTTAEMVRANSDK